MIIDICSLLLSLSIILISCELFTNGIEWLGKILKVGDGVEGSLFSAVGTCLPETVIPLIAILPAAVDKAGITGKSSVAIGLGAIVGAPFMLSTLAFFITGLSVVLFFKKRKYGMKLMVKFNIIARDLCFFLITYSASIIVSVFNNILSRRIAAAFLIICYVYYMLLTIKDDKQSIIVPEKLYITEVTKVKPSAFAVITQILLALTGIITGAQLFVTSIMKLSHQFGISPLVLSLIITPIATELPEKFNSVIWIRKGRDTLALGNITGAMVFQSCIPVAIGLLATNWDLTIGAQVCGMLAIISALFTYVTLNVKKHLTVLPLIGGGILYVVYIIFLKSRNYF